MKLRKRFPKREYHAKSPWWLIILFLIILGMITMLNILKGG